MSSIDDKNLPLIRQDTAPKIIREMRHFKEEDNRTSWYRVIDLNELVQISFYYTLSRVIFSFIGYLLFVALFLYEHGTLGLSAPPSELARIELFALKTVFILLLANALRLELWRKSFQLQIDGFNIRLSYGVMEKLRLIFCFNTFLSVYLRQSYLDAFFGLYSVEINTINSPGAKFTTIPSLSRSRATALKDYITREISRFGAPSKSAESLRALREGIKE
jgi:membrane protein YdbS with pleckstrin-like domain